MPVLDGRVALVTGASRGIGEAALALCSGDPAHLTGRIAYSLRLLEELGRPIRTLDGRALYVRAESTQGNR